MSPASDRPGEEDATDVDHGCSVITMGENNNIMSCASLSINHPRQTGDKLVYRHHIWNPYKIITRTHVRADGAFTYIDKP